MGRAACAFERIAWDLRERVAGDPDPQRVRASEDGTSLCLRAPRFLLLRSCVGKRPRRRRQSKSDARVNAILAHATDCRLQLPSRAIEIKELAHACERLRNGHREVAVAPLTRLRILAKTRGVQQRGKSERAE